VARVVAALVVTVALAALAYAALPDLSGPHWVNGRTGRHLVETAGPLRPDDARRAADAPSFAASALHQPQRSAGGNFVTAPWRARGE
jgi:hypothetical protein